MDAHLREPAVHPEKRTILARGGKRDFPLPVQKAFRWVGKAIEQYRMIEAGDRIVVGVSGIDSLCLLWILRERLKWIPVTYEVKAVYIDLGFEGAMSQAIEEYLRREAYDFEIVRTDIGLTAHSPVNRENPCFLCSRERRKKLFMYARDRGYNKIALGHHLEDINATLFINIIYGGSISTMMPCQELFHGRLTIIRPLAMLYKEQIQRLAKCLSIPSVENPCPSSNRSERREVGDFLNRFYKKDPRIRYNIFRAMRNIHKEYLPT
jgi:tRNA 2-thiocytidine biosynthesis protein TtcA